MITRYQLITVLLNEMGLDNSYRTFIARVPDSILLSNTGYKCIRKGYYTT